MKNKLESLNATHNVNKRKEKFKKFKDVFKDSEMGDLDLDRVTLRRVMEYYFENEITFPETLLELSKEFTPAMFLQRKLVGKKTYEKLENFFKSKNIDWYKNSVERL